MPNSQSTLETAQAYSHLSEEQLRFFKENGYLALPRITSDEEVVDIRQILENLFETKAGHDQGAYFNFAGAEEDKDAPNIPQIVAPNNFAGKLKKTEFRRNVAEIARQILGPGATFHIDHTLCKPPINGAATPWHQDEAFKDPKYDYQEISIWMPLQPVNEVNGCMQFVPGSHRRGILPHRTPNDDPRIHAVECSEGFDAAEIVSCPLPAGGCTIHTGRTLHGAGPNRSNAPRYAYVLIFHVPPELAKSPKMFPWLQGKNTARMQRTNKWLESGGKFINLWRVFRNKELHDYKRTFLKLKKRLLGYFGR